MFAVPGLARLLAGASVFLLAGLPLAADEMPEVPKTARIKIHEPKNYAEIRGAIKFRVEAVDMTTEPAGEARPGAGHHHFIINSVPPKKGDVIPKDEKHIHWGDGRTEGEIELKPGLYTIAVQFADGFHRSYGQKLQRVVLIRVKK